MTTFADILGEPLPLNVRGLQITYRPDAITPGVMMRIITEAGSEDPIRVLQAYRETVPRFIASWDLVNEGQPVPLTPEGVDNVPVAILDLVFAAIMDDRESRRSEEGNASSASSDAPQQDSTTPSSMGSHLNGSDSSPPLASITSVPGNS